MHHAAVEMIILMSIPFIGIAGFFYIMKSKRIPVRIKSDLQFQHQRTQQ